MIGRALFFAAVLMFGLARVFAADTAIADPVSNADGLRCSGERFAISTVARGASPYIALSAAERNGFFLLDYGTTASSLARDRFERAGARAPDVVVGDFSLPTFQSGRFWFSDYGLLDAPPGGQLGIVGTDFLSLLTADFTFRPGGGDVSFSVHPCDAAKLRARGMIAVRQDGFFSNDLRNVARGTPNVPVLFLGIGGVSTFAQIDTGYEDRSFPPSIDINDALYDKLIASGIALWHRGQASIVTCHGAVTNEVLSVEAPVFLQTDAGEDIRPIMRAALIRKRSNGCGGIADMRRPAAQLGMSVIASLQSIVIDPRAGIVWVPER